MADWEITATTIFCEDVSDEVTLMVTGNNTVKCTGREKYVHPTKEVAGELRQKSKKSGRRLGCLEDKCPRLPKYRDGYLGGK
jgi:hypothetical protein